MGAFDLGAGQRSSLACRLHRKARARLRTASLPRKEKAMLDTPPLILHPGQRCLIRRVALMKSTA